MGTVKPIKMRTMGSNPVQKWINLVVRWNSCEGMVDNQYAHQRMIVTMVEARELIIQYPELHDAIKRHAELATEQIESLRYGLGKFTFELPSNAPKPKIINGYNLLKSDG